MVHIQVQTNQSTVQYGKRKTMLPCTNLPLYSDLVCKTALHLNTRAAGQSVLCSDPIVYVQNSWVTHTTHTHSHHTCLDEKFGRGDLPFPHDTVC